MEQHASTPPENNLSTAETEAYLHWWAGLSAPWKTAFNEVTLQRSSTEALPVEVLHSIWTASALRFAGPTAPFPNMSLELDNLDGIAVFPKLEIFVFTHHKIQSLAPLAKLPGLKSLFVFDNQITALDGVEALTELRELYFQGNRVESLRPLEHLTQLQTLYCPNNRLRALDGIGKQHAGALRQFVCLPNEELPDAEIIRMEREVGVRCQKG